MTLQSIADSPPPPPPCSIPIPPVLERGPQPILGQGWGLFPDQSLLAGPGLFLFRTSLSGPIMKNLIAKKYGSPPLMSINTHELITRMKHIIKEKLQLFISHKNTFTLLRLWWLLNEGKERYCSKSNLSGQNFCWDHITERQYLPSAYQMPESILR